VETPLLYRTFDGYAQDKNETTTTVRAAGRLTAGIVDESHRSPAKGWAPAGPPQG
jgi:hypothetical protein